MLPTVAKSPAYIQKCNIMIFINVCTVYKILITYKWRQRPWKDLWKTTDSWRCLMPRSSQKLLNHITYTCMPKQRVSKAEIVHLYSLPTYFLKPSRITIKNKQRHWSDLRVHILTWSQLYHKWLSHGLKACIITCMGKNCTGLPSSSYV